jgi:tetratricopeptide (TPR) repeat protein
MEHTMKSCRFDRQAWLHWAALLAVFLPSASPAGGQAGVAARTGDEKQFLPTRKTADDDPPLPSKQPVPGKEYRVQVTSPSALVQTGDKVIATARWGEVLPFTKKTDEYFLVIVNGSKGWIKKLEVREVEATIEGQNVRAIERPLGPTTAVIDKDTVQKVKNATAQVRVRLINGTTIEGSGFFAAEPDLVLTNAHVLGMLSPGSPMPAEVRVVVGSGEPEEFTLPAQVLGVDRENDLGVLRVKGRASRFPAPLTVDSSRSLALLQKVYIFGYPYGKSLGKDITASESSISSIRKDATGSATEVQVNGGMHQGNSGGPVVDSHGVVVGVAVSGLYGTQINFAVPGEKVQELLSGRVAQTQVGEAFLEKGQSKLPIRLSCLDPLQRIRTIQLEVWVGTGLLARPPSPTDPKSFPGDGPSQSITVKYQDGVGKADVSIPSLASGQSFWIRPVLTDANGGKHWAGAVAFSAPDLPPLERKAAVLQQNFDRQAQRTLKLTGSVNAQISKGLKQTLFRDSMEVELLETAAKEPRGGRFDLSLGGYKFTTAEMNEPSLIKLPEAQAFLRGRNLTYIVEPQGAMLLRTIPTLLPPYPDILREDFSELVHQIANYYELTCIAVPNRRVEAQESWDVRVPLILTYQNNKEIVDMLLSCTYEGSRLHEGQEFAVISLSGVVKARKPGLSTTGTVTGKVHFSIVDGYLSLAKIKVESLGGNDALTIAHSLEVSLARVPGNTNGIVARPLSPSPIATDTDYELALPHLQKRDFKKAIPLLEQAVEAHPNLVKAQIELGFAYNEVGQFDKAIPCFKKALALVPNHVTAHNNLGAAYNGKRLFDEAILSFKKVIELDPNHAVAYHNLGFAYNAKKLYDQAIPCFRRAIEIDPQYVSAHSKLGIAYREKGLHDQAIVCFKRAIELAPKQAIHDNHLGISYMDKGLYGDAIPCFKKALELDPKLDSASNNLGLAYNAMGLYDQGIPFMKKAVEIQPKNGVAYINLADALGEVGEFAQAHDVLKKAAGLIPETAPSFKRHAELLGQTDAFLRLESSLSDIVKGEKKFKNYQEGIQYGRLCRVKQHYQAALRLYEEADAMDPEAAKKKTPLSLLVGARVAVLASAGSGSDPPPEVDRPKVRSIALEWLHKFIKAQQEALEKDFNTNRYSCQINLRVLLQHKGFDSVRPESLNNFPAAERKEWEKFWNDVDVLLEKADAIIPD